jgi:two-component system LytT family sensor kinase
MLTKLKKEYSNFRSTEYSKRIFWVAIFSSPLISVYGVSPVFIFEFIPFNEFLYIFIALTLLSFVGWMFNAYLIYVFESMKTWKRYILSFLCTFFLHGIAISLGKDFSFVPNRVGNFWITIYPIFSIMAFNTISLIVLNLIKTQEKNKQTELAFKNLSLSTLEAEKKLLQQQLQPHFLFNSLSTMKSLIQENQDAAEEYAVQLSAFLRYSIEATKMDLVLLEDELGFTMSYLKLQQTRFPNSLFCHVDIHKRFYDRKIPSFALQTLIENAIKHNQFTSKRPLKIEIKAKDNSLLILNNIQERKVTTQSTKTGLSNLNKRYELISGKGIKVKEKTDLFTVVLELI